MSDYKYYRNMSIETIEKRLAPNVNKRGRQPLFEYPFEGMARKDTVVYPASVKNSFPTIRRAACRYGQRLNRIYTTSVLSDGRLAVQRSA